MDIQNNGPWLKPVSPALDIWLSWIPSLKLTYELGKMVLGRRISFLLGHFRPGLFSVAKLLLVLGICNYLLLNFSGVYKMGSYTS